MPHLCFRCVTTKLPMLQGSFLRIHRGQVSRAEERLVTILMHRGGVEVSSPYMNAKRGQLFHSTLKCIYQIRSQLVECGEWRELLAFLWGSRTHKSRPIILCWNKSDTDTAVKKKKKKKKRSMTGAKGQIQVLRLSLVIQGNPAFNKNKYLGGETRSSNDSL